MDLAMIVSVFIASILGSVHCAAMCGGLAGFCASCGPRALSPTLSYHLGRAISYTMLGAFFGAFGAGINLLVSSLGFRDIAPLVVGALLILWGLVALRSSRAPSVLQEGAGRVSRLVGKQLRVARADSSGVLLGALTGLLTIFLPCGWLYAFLLVSASTGDPWIGATLMFFFWLGSVPALLLVAAGFRVLTPKVRSLAPRLGASFLILAGMLSIFARGEMMALVPTSLMGSVPRIAEQNSASPLHSPLHSEKDSNGADAMHCHH